MKVAIFDLDHTLLPLDTGDTWTHYVIDRLAPELQESLRQQADVFHRGYVAGSFDVNACLDFQLHLLTLVPRSELDAWRRQFVETVVKPQVLEVSLQWVQDVRDQGFTPVLATGTHRYIAEPIAPLLGIGHVVAATPERDEYGLFTGRLVGSHSYREGKLHLVQDLLASWQQQGQTIDELQAYSDSINDEPLLRWVAQQGGSSVVVNGDRELKALAAQQGWACIELFEKV